MNLKLALVALAIGTANLSVPAEGRSEPHNLEVDSNPLTDLKAWLALPEGERMMTASVLTRPLDRATADAALAMLAAARSRTVAARYRDAVATTSISLHGKTLRWESRTFGTAPADGRSLWISLHGGGNAPAALNDRQWRNQLRLYEPDEGIYLAPRAPTDTWNLWHEEHIDPLLQQLIDAHVALNGVNPDKVYLLGYSAGGDGVWQLAPRMADRFSAAATMAGHPNEASLLSVRNLPFAIFMGGADSAYGRNRVAAEKTAELQLLRSGDPDGYTSMSRIYDGLPHWMDGRDAEALPWMARFVRNPWPRRVVWFQDDVTNDRFYWLQIPDRAKVKAGDRIDAAIEAQNIALTGNVPPGMVLRLSDRLLDLDQAVSVTVNGKVVFRGEVPRTAFAMQESLLQRADANSAATALLTLE